MFVLVPKFAAAEAGAIVKFQSAPVHPSPFKVKRAKAKGIVLKPKPGIELIGILSRPKIKGPHPAVIILVSGDGLQDSHLVWGETLANWGYVGLVVDSFGSRGGTDYRNTAAVDIPADSYSAFSYLHGLKFVNGQKIAVLGFSLGGSRLFTILDNSNAGRPEDIHFKAGIAVYPNCVTGKQYAAPILILAGDNDPLMTLEICKAVYAQSRQHGNVVSLQIYPGATHFFDNPNYSKNLAQRYKNATLPLWFRKNHYNEEAHRDALDRAKEFLDQHLK
jgi:dienelactone hydrolase